MVRVTVTGSPAATSSERGLDLEIEGADRAGEVRGLPDLGERLHVQRQRVRRHLEPTLLAAEEGIVEEAIEAASAAAAAPSSRAPSRRVRRSECRSGAASTRSRSRAPETARRGLLLSLVGLGELVEPRSRRRRRSGTARRSRGPGRPSASPGSAAVRGRRPWCAAPKARAGAGCRPDCRRRRPTGFPATTLSVAVPAP